MVGPRQPPSAGPLQIKPVWLVEVRLENVATDPWLLLTDWPITDEASAVRDEHRSRRRLHIRNLRGAGHRLDSIAQIGAGKRQDDASRMARLR